MEDFEKGFEIEMDVIEIEKEDGTIEECGIQDEFEIDDRSYMVLSPIGDDNFLNDEIVYFFRVEYEGEDMLLEDVEDEEELKIVKAAYEDFLDPDVNDFEDED